MGNRDEKEGKAKRIEKGEQEGVKMGNWGEKKKKKGKEGNNKTKGEEVKVWEVK